MRAILSLPLLMLAVLPGLAAAEAPGISPSAAIDRNQAKWADLEAQARITDGDYEGALQAERQAQAARDRADQQAVAARGARRP